MDLRPGESALTGTTEGDPVLADPRRLAAVRRVLAAGVESTALDGLTRLAADLLGAEAAQVSLLVDHQVIASITGVDLEEDARTGAAADSLCTVTLQRGSPVAITDAAHDQAVAHLPPVRAGAVGAYLGAPLFDSGGERLGALCVYDRRPRAWAPADVAVLERLARAVVAELELRALRTELQRESARLDLALSAADIGSYEYDPGTGGLQWDRRLRLLFGYEDDDFVPHLDSFTQRVHPDDLARVLHALERAVGETGEFQEEYRVVLPDGRVRWIAARGALMTVEGAGGSASRLLGAAYDSTTVRDARDAVARVLETMGDAFISLDREWRVAYVNARAEMLLGRSRSELVGRVVWDEYPSAAGDSPFWRHYHEAMDDGRTVEFEAYYPAPLDAWYEVRAQPSPEGINVYFHETTARRRAEAERQAAQDRLRLVADTTQALVSTLDVQEAMERLAGLLVGPLADWVSVALVDEGGRLENAVARHRDGGLGPVMARFASLHTAVQNPRSRSQTVLRSGRPVLEPQVDLDDVLAAVDDPELRAILSEIGLASLLVVPLTGRGEGVGVLALARVPGSPAFGPEDLTTAVEIGQRAGLAVHNARLYAQQQRTAEVLQRSLLTELPEPDHLELGARYRPAAAQAAVGGDWYDAALQPDGATVLSIGDVMGHDISATAAMGQVRTLLRGIAFDSRDTPAGVLRRVDAAMQGLAVGTLATAVVARVEQDDELRAAGLRRLRWSNAGHPPPMLLRADGSVEQVNAPADLLLGLDPETDRADHALVLQPGDTLLLYTDGLVERRDSPLETGLARLRQALTGRAGVPLDRLLDDVLQALLPTEQEDDVAVIALRAHPEDRPRPAEAGPNRYPDDLAPGTGPAL